MKQRSLSLALSSFLVLTACTSETMPPEDDAGSSDPDDLADAGKQEPTGRRTPRTAKLARTRSPARARPVATGAPPWTAPRRQTAE
jgi:hypothetical protein